MTHEQFHELLKKPGVKKANPHLAGMVPKEREPNPKPALVKDLPRQSGNRSSLAVSVLFVAMRHRLLDEDNLVAGFKHLRDVVSRTLGVDDADPRIQWRCSQCRTDGREGTVVVIRCL